MVRWASEVCNPFTLIVTPQVCAFPTLIHARCSEGPLSYLNHPSWSHATFRQPLPNCVCLLIERILPYYMGNPRYYVALHSCNSLKQNLAVKILQKTGSKVKIPCLAGSRRQLLPISFAPATTSLSKLQKRSDWQKKKERNTFQSSTTSLRHQLYRRISHAKWRKRALQGHSIPLCWC